MQGTPRRPPWLHRCPRRGRKPSASGRQYLLASVRVFGFVGKRSGALRSPLPNRTVFVLRSPSCRWILRCRRGLRCVCRGGLGCVRRRGLCCLRRESRIVKRRSGRNDIAEEGDDLRARNIQCLAIERRAEMVGTRLGRSPLALLAGVTFIVAGGTTEADESKGNTSAASGVRGAGLLVATGLTIIAFQHLPITAPLRCGNLNVANDQHLLWNHRQQWLICFHLAGNRAVADAVFLVVYEIPVFHIEKITHYPWPDKGAERIFQRDIKVLGGVFEGTLEFPMV